MELSASYSFAAAPQTVWDLLNDPNVVATCLPGCKRLEPIGDDRYRAFLNVVVASVSGEYDATVAMLDKRPPLSYRLVVDGRGKSGFMKGEATVELAPQDDGTLVSVKGWGQVGGRVARVGQRLLGGVSKLMMDRFFARLRKKAQGSEIGDEESESEDQGSGIGDQGSEDGD